MVDYSKWKNIEISDDEDETHPNIDTPSLFRWRHQARIERMEASKAELEAFEKKKSENIKKLNEVKAKLTDSEKSHSMDFEELKKQLEDLEKKADEFKKEEDELKKKDKMTPWNIDTISKPGFAKTVINTKPARPKEENLTEEEREAKMKKFVKENEKDLKHFGMLRKYDDSKAFLKSHNHLVCEETANYLVIWCINLEMEEKDGLMQHVAHQTICMQYILELAKQLDYDPRACVDAFFSKIQVAEVEYKQSFDDELNQFKARIRKRAAEKLEETMKVLIRVAVWFGDRPLIVLRHFGRISSVLFRYLITAFLFSSNNMKQKQAVIKYLKIVAEIQQLYGSTPRIPVLYIFIQAVAVEEEERQKRLGPGGLDPIEVFETLPEDLKKCFESQDVGLLQETIAKMDTDEAKYHMKRCVDSGLWVPDAKKQEEAGDAKDLSEAKDVSEPSGSSEQAQYSV